MRLADARMPDHPHEQYPHDEREYDEDELEVKDEDARDAELAALRAEVELWQRRYKEQVEERLCLQAELEKYSRERNSLLAAAAGAEATVESMKKLNDYTGKEFEKNQQLQAELSRLRALCAESAGWILHPFDSACDMRKDLARKLCAAGREEG